MKRILLATVAISLALPAYAASSNFYVNSANGNVGIGTTTPSNWLSLDGQAARTIWMERNYTTSTPGNSLVLQAGGATSGATDKAGGNLVLSSGTSTGTGSSQIQFKTFPAAGSTGSTDNVAATAMTITGDGNVGIGIAPTHASDKLVINSSADASNVFQIFAHNSNLLFRVFDTPGGLLSVFDATGAEKIRLYGGSDASTYFKSGNVGIGTDVANATLDVYGGTFLASRSGTAPSVSSCGTSPAVTGTNNSMVLTMGTGTVASCTVTFNPTWTTAPNACVMSAANAAATAQATTLPYVSAISTATLTFTAAGSGNMAGAKYYVHCM